MHASKLLPLLAPISLAACTGGISDQNVAETETTLNEDLIYFSSLYDGEFSNFGAGDKDEAVRHYVYRRIDLPAFGDDVVYVQQYYGAGDGDKAGQVYRQRIYASHADKDRNELVTRIYSFKGDTAGNYVDSQFITSKLKNLKPEDMDILPDGCEIFWNRENEEIIGYQKPGVCVIEQPESDAKMLLSDDLKLTKTSFTTKTIGSDEDGNRLFGGDAPLPMYKANIYNCKISAGNKKGNARLHDLAGVAMLDEYGFEGELRLTRQASISLESPLQIALIAKDKTVAAKVNSSDGFAKLDKDGLTVSCKKAQKPWAKSY